MAGTEDILRKVRELEIKSKRLTRHLFTGEYHSAFKGRGMLFKEVREYQQGDDPRFMDWNVSARLNHPFTKVFEEERELTVMLLVDVSASSLFGTLHARKKDLLSEIAAVLAFSAISNNDKVGAVFFSERSEFVIPPRKGRDHVLYMVRKLIDFNPRNSGTSLREGIRRLNNAIRRNCIVFILSDFISDPFEDALKVAGKKHDVVGIRVYDRADMLLPQAGLLCVGDAETGDQAWVDTNDPRVRQEYQDRFFAHSEYCRQVFRKAGCDLLHVRTDEDYVQVLQKFFISRNG